MEKIRSYICEHKIRFIILSALLLGSIIFAWVQLELTYNFVIDEYEKGHDNIQTCEDGVTALSRMKYYKNSKNYIKQMKRSIIEDYCDRGQFEEAKNYLDRNYEESLEDMYMKIEKCKSDYEEAQRIEKYNSIEGRTERVKKMYEQMGVGGCDEDYYVLEALQYKLYNSTLHDLEYILPVWNRNETYYSMMVNDIMKGVQFDINNYYTYYGIEDYSIEEDYKFYPFTYKKHLQDTYNIDIDVQEVNVYTYMARTENSYSGISFRNYLVVFKTEDKWFFGGVLSSSQRTSYSIIPADSHYKGEIIEE